MVEKKKLKEELKLKDGMKSLAQELKERIFKTESFQEFDKKESKSDFIG